MQTKEDVNQLFLYSKYFIDYMNRNQDVPKELKEMQYLSCAGIFAYYGFQEVDSICKLFQKTKFIYTQKAMEEFFPDTNIIGKNNDDLYCPALFVSDIMRTSSTWKINRKIYVSSYYKQGYAQQLTSVIHEINHIMNNIKNPICKHNGSFVFRQGISISEIYGETRENLYLEEAFNTLQTSEIMQLLFLFGQYEIEDKEIQRALNKFIYSYHANQDTTYFMIVPSVQPLYQTQPFYSLLKEKRYTGDISMIKEHFNQKVGANALEELSREVDLLYQSDFKLSQIKHKIKINQFVSKYVR